MSLLPHTIATTLILSNLIYSNISGTVYDRAGNKLAGVSITLKSSKSFAMTDSSGTWSIISNTTNTDPDSKRQSIKSSGNRIELFLPTASQVSIQAFDLQGNTIGDKSTFSLSAGTHTLPISLNTTSLAFLRIRTNNEYILQTVLNGRTIKQYTSNTTPYARSLDNTNDTLWISFGKHYSAAISVQNPSQSSININLDTSTAGWSDSLKYESVYDARDGYLYRAIQIGNQVWMAENLNFGVDSSWWVNGANATVDSNYNDSLFRGARFGRLYSWSTAMAFPDSCNFKKCSYLDSLKSDSLHQGICPIGWHLPNNSAWLELINYVEADIRVRTGSAGRALKANFGWAPSKIATGWDYFGFRALPAGIRYYSGERRSTDDEGIWWSSTEDINVTSGSFFFYMTSTTGNCAWLSAGKYLGASVRCIRRTNK